MTTFDEYAKKYADIRMQRRDGILEVVFHTDGGSLKWTPHIHREAAYAFTGEQIQPAEAKSLGIVQEVMPREKLLPRAWQLAEEMVKKNPLTLRYARACVVQPLKRAFLDNLGYGLALEGLAGLNRPLR